MRHRGRAYLSVLGIVTLLAASDSSAAQRTRPRGPDTRKAQGQGRAFKAGEAPDVVGTVTYDNNIAFSRDGSVAQPIGNKFDIGFLDPHSINAIAFKLAGAFSGYVAGGVRASVYDINPTAMTNMQLVQFNAPAANQGTLSTILWTAMLPAPITNHSGPFVAAVFNSPSSFCNGSTGIGTTCEGIALSMGGVDPGMGFHAIRVSNGGVTAQNLGTKNAIMRATGDNLPVELMGFGVN